jgi:hypothetical protein
MFQKDAHRRASHLGAILLGFAVVSSTACRTRNLAPLGEHSANGITSMTTTPNPPPTPSNGPIPSSVPVPSKAPTPSATSTPARPPPKPLPDGFNFSGSPELGYVTDFGSSLRSSRVLGKPRNYQRLRRIPVEALPKLNVVPLSAQLVPRMVLVSPDAQHIVVDWGEVFEIRNGKGMPVSLGGKGRGGLLYLRNERPYAMGNLHDWSGEFLQQGRSTHFLRPNQGVLSSVRISQDLRMLFCQGRPTRESPSDITTRAIVESFLKPDQSYRIVQYEKPYTCYMGYLGSAWPRSTSAIDEAFWGVLALRWGELHVLSSQAVQADNAPAVEHGFVVYYHISDVSIVPPGMAVVEEAAPDVSGFGQDLVAQEVPATTVHYLTPQGIELWKVTVGFGLGQPPIDCGDGRVCLAGFGLASVKNGKIEWSMKSPALPPQETWPKQYYSPPAPVRATAFEDGTLAVANHRTLRILERDGSIRREYKVGEDELIYTPPAIAPDGRVWFATQHALYCLE